MTGEHGDNMPSSGPSSELPPRPDASTGQPAPSAAPTQFPDGNNERWRSAVLARPPAGRGPVLASYRQKRSLSWLGGFIPVVVLVLCFLAYDGMKALSLWPIWLILVGVYAWTVVVHRVNTVSAGADWVRAGRKYWVDTYDLSRIHLRSAGTNAPTLFLVDSDERTVEIALDLLQASRPVWNYVHLGLLHSAAHGADINLAALASFPELAEASGATLRRIGRREGA